MKVSEAINKLEVGETVWVKGTVNEINYEGEYIKMETRNMYMYLDLCSEISLTEPRVDKVEVELTRSQADFMKEHENDSLYKLMRASIPEYEELFARARLNGYTVKPKRWVVKMNIGYFMDFEEGCDDEGFEWVSSSKVGCLKFVDKSKAEAVATLVEGSVEEV